MDEREWINPEKFEPERYRNHPSLAPDYVASDKRDHFGLAAPLNFLNFEQQLKQ